MQLPSAKGYAMALRVLFPEYLGLFGSDHGYTMTEPTLPLFANLEPNVFRESINTFSLSSWGMMWCCVG